MDRFGQNHRARLERISCETLSNSLQNCSLVGFKKPLCGAGQTSAEIAPIPSFQSNQANPFRT